MKSLSYTKTTDLLHCLGAAEGDLAGAANFARKQMLMKTAVGDTQHGDLSGDFASTLGGEFLTLMEPGVSVFDTVKAASRRARFNTPLFVGKDPIIAKIVGESLSIPVVRYSVDSAGLTPSKAAGIAVITKEAAQSREGAEALVEELRQAVGLATDIKFLADLADLADTSEAASADPLADLKKLLNGVNLSGGGALFLAVGPGVANTLATMRNALDGLLLFPDMTPTGGQVCGVQTLVTAALTDKALLIDASAVVTGDEEMTIKTSENALLEMDSHPAMDSATPTGPGESGEPATPNALVSAFQLDLLAVLGIRSFASKLVRPSGVGVLTSITWGQ